MGIAGEILDLIKGRQQITPRNGKKNKMLEKHRRNKCKKTNEQWIKEKCAEIEKLQNMQVKCMHKVWKKQKRQEIEMFFNINSKEGTIIILVYKI